MIRRQAHSELAQWIQKKQRNPLLIRGSRRVGKTSLVRSLGSRYFDWVLHVNFNERPEYVAAFDELKLPVILNRLQSISGVDIRPGRTLLLIDEIQACPNAIEALPLFACERGDIHVIACLTTLMPDETNGEKEQVLSQHTESLYLQPFSFREFLRAMGQDKLDSYLGTLGVEPLHRSVTSAMKKHLRAYLTVGGMPEAVATYARGSSPWDLERCHHSILASIQADFSSLGSNSQRKYLNEVFHAAPRLVGRTCKYSQINDQMQARDLKRALRKLWGAGCVHPVYHSASTGKALGQNINLRKFHLLCADTGLMGRALSLRSRINGNEKLLSLDAGGPARQFVGQQLMATIPSYMPPKLYFWAREARNSNARVDFLAPLGEFTIPVVVRGGKRGTLKSLDIFLKEHPSSPFAIRFSEDELSFSDRVLSMPLYLAPYWKSFARKALKAS